MLVALYLITGIFTYLIAPKHFVLDTKDAIYPFRMHVIMVMTWPLFLTILLIFWSVLLLEIAKSEVTRKANLISNI